MSCLYIYKYKKIVTFFNSLAMHIKNLFPVLALFMFSQAHAQFAQWDWISYGIGYNNLSGHDNLPAGNSVCVDAAHNVYVLGAYYGSLQLDTFNFTGGQNVFLAKYNAVGQLQWARGAISTQMYAYNSNYGNVVNVDNAGNIYIGGNFKDTIVIGNVQMVSTTVNEPDIFLAKYTTDGNLVWAKSAGGPGRDVINYGEPFNQFGGGMKVDNAGHIYITGMFGYNNNRGSGNYSVPALTTFDTIKIQSDSTGSIFLAKYDTSGHIIWVKKSTGTNNFPIAFDLAVDDAGNAFITGGFKGNLILDTIKVYEPPLASVYNFMFIAKYNSNGDVLWAKEAGGHGETDGISLVADHAGNVIVTGILIDSATFGATILPSGSNNDNGFIAKYNIDGNLMWAKNMDVNHRTENFPHYMTVDTNDNMYIIGSFKDTCTFDNKAIVSNGGYDIYITRYSSDGSLQWLTSVGGSQDDAGFGITTDNTGAIYVTGGVADTCSFGSYTISGTNHNMFIAKATPPNTVVAQVLPAQRHIAVYPNPANSTVTIALAAGNFTAVRVTDCLGRVVYLQWASGQKSIALNTVALAGGTYFVTTSSGAGGSLSGKFVIVH
jgi:hypothetical protein